MMYKFGPFRLWCSHLRTSQSSFLLPSPSPSTISKPVHCSPGGREWSKVQRTDLGSSDGVVEVIGRVALNCGSHAPAHPIRLSGNSAPPCTVWQHRPYPSVCYSLLVFNFSFFICIWVFWGFFYDIEIVLDLRHHPPICLLVLLL